MAVSVLGKTFVVTGGASGLGALYAEAFLKEGASKIALLDINEELGKATTARLNNDYPGKVIFVKCDMSKEEQIASSFDEVLKAFKQIDVVINNAGIMSDSPQLWRTACDVNIQGLISMTMRSLKHMRTDEGGAGGTIVNIASTAALFRFRALPAYAAAKMAVLHFSHSLAMDPFFEETGVRVLVMCPGPTDTPLMQSLKERSYASKTGDELEQEVTSTTEVEIIQKTESAVAAVVKMFKEGSCGSVWLSIWNKPAQDITSTIDNAWNSFEALQAP